jgi:cyclopropane fatty-acyl-phospholipid synthase-like methyltransferase
MPWYFGIAERDHEIQNPTSAEKIRLLGERLRLGPSSHVLDVACGKAGPAVILAREFGCRVTGVERAPEFAAAARERVASAHLDQLVEVVERDATEFELEPERFDVAMCLGASFVWAGLEGTLAALVPTVRPGGHVVVGEPYWRR